MNNQIAKTGRVFVLPDCDAQAKYLADWILHQAKLKEKERLSIALSGGSTPKKLYELLGKSPYNKQIPWEKIHLFFGDERMVPHSHEDSNYYMVNKALLSYTQIPFRNVHLIPVQEDIEAAAASYQRELQDFYGAKQLQLGKPLFDIVLLGLGNDGHTASLFPGTPVLKEKTKWVSWSKPSDAPYKRITLTYPAIASSRHVVFVVSGAGKEEILRKIRNGEGNYPAASIYTEGEIHWVVDATANGKE